MSDSAKIQGACSQENASPSSRYSSRYGQPVPVKDLNGHGPADAHAHEHATGRAGSPSSSSSSGSGKSATISNGAYARSGPVTRSETERMQAAVL